MLVLHKIPIFEFTFKILKTTTKAKVLLDCGSQLNLINVFFAKENNIPYTNEADHPEV